VAGSGCAVTLDDQVVGVWVVDNGQITLPPLPERFAKRVRSGLEGTLLKLRTDHTFVLVSTQSVKGTWKLDEGQVLLHVTKVPAGVRIPAFMDEGAQDIHLHITEDRRFLQLEQPTPAGPVIVALYKSG